MRKVALNLITFSLIVCSFGAQAQIVYQLDRTVGPGTVKGTIETDGTIGSLTPANILSWSFEAFDGTDTISISSVGGFLQGEAWAYLSATDSELVFDFAGVSASNLNQRYISFHDGDTFSFDYNLLGNFLGELEQLVHQFGEGEGHQADGFRTGMVTIAIVDQDGDGVKDLIDNCPATPNTDQENGDDDAFGDACDTDDDNDGVPDEEDLFPLDPTEWGDTDGDGIGNNSDSDDDNDNVADIDDNCPLDANELQEDYESDGLGDVCDPDDDNDGVADISDQYPYGQFDDSPTDYWAFRFIESVGRAGITAGCGNNNYCPTEPVTRAQMAVFLERGMNGSGFSPPAAIGNVFLDVGAQDFAASFIEQLSNDGITSGCGNSNYCPDDEVTRAQMAVFLLRAKHGSSYSPPPATGVFDDVDLGHWAVHWIEQLAVEGITAGCGGGNYCPDAQVTRDQMAVFLVRTFEL